MNTLPRLRVMQGGVALVSAMALVVVAGSSGVANAEAEEFDALDAIQEVVPGVMLDGEIIDATVDQAVDTSGLEVTVPSDPQDGISVEPESGGSFTIGLPFAADAELTNGEQGVVYDNGNGSSTVPLVKADGVVQIITTIADESAPVAYVYPLDLPEGGRLELLDDRGALVLDSFGEVVATIDAPWARDAGGKSVPTYYAVSGDSLVQVVAHGPGDTYPIVADPKISLGWAIYVKYSKSEVKSMVSGLRGSLSSKAKYGSVLCLGVPSIYAAGLCGLITYDMMDSIYRTFVSANSKGHCVEIQLAYISYVPVNWKTYKC